MIKVTLRNIKDFDLSVFDSKDILDENIEVSKKILKNLEKEYEYKSHIVCRRSKDIKSEFEIYQNPMYSNISAEDKYRWLTNYEIYVRNSLKYRLCKFIYKTLFKKV